MKRIATLQSYLDAARAANSALDHDNSFARLARTANEVAVLAWSMESMHRRHGRGRTH